MHLLCSTSLCPTALQYSHALSPVYDQMRQQQQQQQGPRWIAYLVLKGAVAPRQHDNLPRKGVGVAEGGAAISRDPSHQGVDSTSTDSTSEVVAKIGQHDGVDAVSS